MKREILLIGTIIMGAALSASASIIVSVDENGNGFITQDNVTKGLNWSMSPDPSGKLGLGNKDVLVYDLSSIKGWITPGDVILKEQGGGVSDVIRFWGSDLIFYSDIGDNDKADTGLPCVTLGTWMTEHPIPGGVGTIYRPDCILDPGANLTWSRCTFKLQDVTYQIYSEVPEPSTILAGALVLLPFGAGALRALRRNKAA